MAQTTDRVAGTALFDKYLLPKLALTVILAASLTGTVVSATLTGRSLAVGVSTWVFFVSVGVLAGGLLWKHTFVRPQDVSAADGYCRRQYERYDRLAGGALVLLVPAAVIVLRTYARDLDPALVAALGVELGVLVVLAGREIRADRSAAVQFRHPAGVATLLIAVLAVATAAVAEVALAGRGLTAIGVRVLHLGAFAVWIGGAVWNIFVAVPAGQRTPTTAVVQAAGEQLERFRWAVRLVLPILVLTGLYQAGDAVGTTLAPYLGTAVGLAVLAKLGFVVALVGIFLACPMWRACSPIDGVCDLDDLGGSGAEVTGDD